MNSLCFSFGIAANICAMCMPGIVRVRISSLILGKRTAFQRRALQVSCRLKILCISAELGMMWKASDDRGSAAAWD